MKYKKPEIGNKIYVHTRLYISRGSDDFHGGICTINEIEYSDDLPENHFNYCMIGVKERPGFLLNYEYLMDEQDKLKEQFGEQVGYMDPDVDTPWIEDGDFVNDKIYHGPDVW